MSPCSPRSPRLRPRSLALAAALRLGAAGGARAEEPAPSIPAAAPAPQAAGWATAQAAELTRQGAAHAARGEAEEALGRFLEAIRFDATYGPAYLGLGALHERAGDAREAERVYTMGIDRVSGFAEGLRARAALRRRARRLGEAIVDLEAAAAIRPSDAGLLEELAAAYVAAAALPAALAISRRVESLAAARGDGALQATARARARALSLLVGEVDPVRAGLRGRGAVRRAIALQAAGAAPRRGR
ncbi:MAG: tetratricopeptide repeat protein [Polyangiaceae bacterium]|nr:tetratricopeptide repeat protein [Polyangiaceae bacterium]